MVRVHPDALCLKPRLVDAFRGADQQSFQRCRRTRSPGPGSRHFPGQQRQQHQQPLHGRIWWTLVTGWTVFKRLSERPVGLRLKERLDAWNVAVTQHIPKHWPYPVTLHSEEKHSRGGLSQNMNTILFSNSFLAFCHFYTYILFSQNLTLIGCFQFYTKFESSICYFFYSFMFYVCLVF